MRVAFGADAPSRTAQAMCDAQPSPEACPRCRLPILDAGLAGPLGDAVVAEGFEFAQLRPTEPGGWLDADFACGCGLGLDWAVKAAETSIARPGRLVVPYYALDARRETTVNLPGTSVLVIDNFPDRPPAAALLPAWVLALAESAQHVSIASSDIGGTMAVIEK